MESNAKNRRAETKQTAVETPNWPGWPRRLLDRIRGVLLYGGGDVAGGLRTRLTSVSVAPHVTEIQDYTFSGCTNLAEVELNEGTRTIGAAAFLDCVALRSVTVPSAVRKLGSGAFSGCINLVELYLNEGLQVIGAGAFHNCRALRSVIIPSTVTRLDYDAFYGCESLVEVHLNEGLEVVGERAFSGCKVLRRVALPSSVTELGKYAFYGCCSLAEMKLNEGLRVVGENAFKMCTSLRSVTVPSTLTELGILAFSQCCNLSEVIFLGGESLLRHDFLETPPCEEGILNQHNIIEMIGRDAFFGCSLKTVKISASWALLERMERLPPDCWASIVERIRGLPCLELTQDGDILASFPLSRALDNEPVIRDTNLVTARSLCQASQTIALNELREAIILFELATWKSGIGGETDEIDSRVPIPGPAKSLIKEYCGFAGLLGPTIEGS